MLLQLSGVEGSTTCISISLFGGISQALHKIALTDQHWAVFFQRRANLKRLKEREIPDSCRDGAWPRAASLVGNRERTQQSTVLAETLQAWGLGQKVEFKWGCGVSGGGIWQSSDPGMPLVVYCLSSLGVKALSESWKVAAPHPWDPEHPCGHTALTVIAVTWVIDSSPLPLPGEIKTIVFSCDFLCIQHLYSFLFIDNEHLPIHSAKLRRQSLSSCAWECCTTSCCERSHGIIILWALNSGTSSGKNGHMESGVLMGPLVQLRPETGGALLGSVSPGCGRWSLCGAGDGGTRGLNLPPPRPRKSPKVPDRPALPNVPISGARIQLFPRGDSWCLLGSPINPFITYYKIRIRVFFFILAFFRVECFLSFCVRILACKAYFFTIFLREAVAGTYIFIILREKKISRTPLKQKMNWILSNWSLTNTKFLLNFLDCLEMAVSPIIFKWEKQVSNLQQGLFLV